MNTSFWILLALGLLLLMAAISVKVFAFFTAEPKVTVDYLAEYNKISKPDGFDPNDNAADFYKKAYDAYVNPSEAVLQARGNWYEDLNEAQKAVLQEWIEKNAECMKYLEEGNKKKFFWIENEIHPDAWKERDFTAKENEKEYDIQFWPTGQGVTLFEQRARVSAMDGQFEDALKALIECCKISQHMGEQSFSINERALEMAFRILDSYTLDANTLKLWQESWQKIFDEDKYRPSFRKERLVWYGYVQRYFAYHPKGKGRLAWKMAKEFDHFHPVFPEEIKNSRWWLPWSKKKEFERVGPNPRYNCFFGPTSNEVKGMIDKVCEHYDNYGKYIDDTPWFYYYPEQKFQDEIEEWKARHPLPKMMHVIPNLKPYWFQYHRLKAKSSALITIIAILRFKTDHGHYPKSLVILSGRLGFNYLPKMPQDPFSNGHLVYHWLVDDFELYSVGVDFKDDGGKRSQSNFPFSGNIEGDDVFWPPIRKNRDNLKFFPHGYRPGP